MLKITKTKVKALIPSVIGKDLNFTGDIVGEGAIEVQGAIYGNIRCLSVIVEKDAMIRGNITAEKVHVRGEVVGDVTARSVICSATARVSGNIVHQSLNIEEGAKIGGSCKKFADAESEEEPALVEEAPPVTDTNQTQLFGDVEQPKAKKPRTKKTA